MLQVKKTSQQLIIALLFLVTSGLQSTGIDQPTPPAPEAHQLKTRSPRRSKKPGPLMRALRILANPKSWTTRQWFWAKVSGISACAIAAIAALLLCLAKKRPSYANQTHTPKPSKPQAPSPATDQTPVAPKPEEQSPIDFARSTPAQLRPPTDDPMPIQQITVNDTIAPDLTCPGQTLNGCWFNAATMLARMPVQRGTDSNLCGLNATEIAAMCVPETLKQFVLAISSPELRQEITKSKAQIPGNLIQEMNLVHQDASSGSIKGIFMSFFTKSPNGEGSASRLMDVARAVHQWIADEEQRKLTLGDHQELFWPFLKAVAQQNVVPVEVPQNAPENYFLDVRSLFQACDLFYEGALKLITSPGPQSIAFPIHTPGHWFCLIANKDSQGQITYSSYDSSDPKTPYQNNNMCSLIKLTIEALVSMYNRETEQSFTIADLQRHTFSILRITPTQAQQPETPGLAIVFHVEGIGLRRLVLNNIDELTQACSAMQIQKQLCLPVLTLIPKTGDIVVQEDVYTKAIVLLRTWTYQQIMVDPQRPLEVRGAWNEFCVRHKLKNQNKFENNQILTGNITSIEILPPVKATETICRIKLTISWPIDELKRINDLTHIVWPVPETDVIELQQNITFVPKPTPPPAPVAT